LTLKGNELLPPTSVNVNYIARHRKYKRLKPGGGQAYDRSSD
jgi:hypothetical protein